MKQTDRKFALGILFLLLTFIVTARPDIPSIIPQPVHIVSGKGSFKLTPKTRILFSSSSAELFMLADLLAERLRSDAAPLSTAQQYAGSNYILLQIVPMASENPEAYELKVSKKSITISANSGSGIFYGIQTLLQLMPSDIEQAELKKEQVHWPVPVCTINDYPRFPYRAMHLDVSRHFFPVEFVKKYIDLMASYKYNNFHWHLTDDQGWRLEIKKYPLLTTIGSQRLSTPVGRNTSDDNQPYGGYYTQEQALEIVEYARKRYVNIIPEIEMPGHSRAALAAYPELSCTGGPFEVWTEWGVATDIYCAGREANYNFLEDVLTEVMLIFPSKYIHIGGDEAPKTRWEACPLCQKRITDEGLKDEYELQSYFIRRIEKFLNQHGREIIGWDEILEGGLAPGATVMSWRGMEGGIEAAKMSHQVIMTPGTPCYFDHYQGPVTDEPLAIGGYNPLKSVYLFEPVPASLNEKESSFILGAQSNLWTEYIATPQQVEYMVYPRALALAEVNWSPKGNRNWENFTARLTEHLNRLEARNVNFSTSAFTASLQMVYDTTAMKTLAKLQTEIPGATILYRILSPSDSSKWMKYKKPFIITQSSEVQSKVEYNNNKTGRISTKSITVHDAFGTLPLLNTPYSPNYAASGALTLTDGIRAEPTFYHQDWLGFSGDDADLLIDLGKDTMVENVNIGFLYHPVDWIFMPAEVQLSLSLDNIHYTPASGMHPEMITTRQPAVLDYNIVQINTLARYIKLRIKNIGVCPPGHPAEGKAAWLFLDEVMVNQPQN